MQNECSIKRWWRSLSEFLFSALRRLEATSCTVTSGSWLAWLRQAGPTTCWTKSRTWTSSWTTDTCWSEGRTSPRSSGSAPPSCSASGTTSSTADTTRWSTLKWPNSSRIAICCYYFFLFFFNFWKKETVFGRLGSDCWRPLGFSCRRIKCLEASNF